MVGYKGFRSDEAKTRVKKKCNKKIEKASKRKEIITKKMIREKKE